MCNEREDAVWSIHAKPAVDNGLSVGQASGVETIVINPANNDIVSLTVNNMYTKNDHATSGVNRKFDATLVDAIDEVYHRNWDLPEYLPFRECVKMGIQDGIVDGMKRASTKYDKVIADKNKQLVEMAEEAKRWKDAFRGLLNKCQQGVEALDFISRVIHGSGGKKY
jgi:hypothetical protein